MYEYVCVRACVVCPWPTHGRCMVHAAPAPRHPFLQVVVAHSDHGYLLGEHNLWCEHTPALKSSCAPWLAPVLPLAPNP